MIPKIIHHAWYSGNPLPPMFHQWRMSWIKQNPGYSFMFWDEQSTPYVSLSPSGTRLMQMPLKYVVKSDIIRWELLFLYGGVWADTDMECVQSIDSLMGVESFAGVSYPPDGIGNACVGTVPGNPLIAEIRDATNQAVLEDIDASHDNKRLCAKSGATFVGSNYLFRVAKIYPRRSFYPFGVFDRTDPRRMKANNKAKSANEYAIHHWSGTEKDGWGHVKD